MSQVSRLVWRKQDIPEELLPLLGTLEEEYPISCSGRGLKLKARRIEATGGSRVKVSRQPGEVVIEYNCVAAAVRGIGAALSRVECDDTTPFETLGVMLDVSRNMVMTVEHVKMWMRRLALSGYNLLMLYTEDTYQLSDEPYFGRLRGAYSQEEIREIDLYASRLGIEVVGCIQTLGHLEQILKWKGSYGDITDTRSVVMVDEAQTYALIEKMIAFWSETLRSHRIHIGMDETHDLGRGRFLDCHGYESGFTLFNRHLGRVNAICEAQGLAPLLWSDMYFRLSNPEQNYYDLTSPIPEEVRNEIPSNVQLIYWDYYNQDAATYRAMIRRHRELGYDPVMASGIWTWVRPWYDHRQTVATAVPCIEACRDEKVKELFFTMWGDDGAYCNYDSALAGLFYVADLAYGVPADDTPDSATARRFETVCQSSYEGHLIASEITSPLADVPALLLWDDPLLGIYHTECAKRDPDFDLKLADHYDEMLRRLLPFAEESQAGDFEHLVNLLQFLILKLEFRRSLVLAYDLDDRIALRQLAVSHIPALLAALREVNISFRRQWLRTAKPFGLEIIQGRNAAQAARLEETAERVREYLEGRVAVIDELEDRLPPGEKTAQYMNRVRQVTTASSFY